MNARFRVLAALVAAVLGGATLLVASPAAASGGGCQRGGTNGWNVQACISIANGYLLPDFYVDATGSPPLCTIELLIQRMDTFQLTHLQNFPCSLGHHGPVGVVRPTGVEYRAVVRPSSSAQIASPRVS